MNALRSIILGLAVAIIPILAPASEPLFSDDFQDGNADGWKAGGDGDIGLTTYKGNVALRMTENALAAIGVKVPGPGRVSVGASFAADDLEGKDACLLETTLDSGKTWIEVLRVVDGQDDSVTLYTNTITREVDASVTGVFVRARVAGNAANDACWLDNVFVTWAAPAGEVEVLKQRILTREFFLSDAVLEEPVSMLEFTPVGSAVDPGHRFDGTLELAADITPDGFKVILDTFGRVKSSGHAVKTFPSFAFSFTQHGRDLIPLERGVITGEHSYWELVVQPGVVWREAGDGNWSRAAVPFALQERAANCTHNGVLTWLFDSEDNVSRVVYQVSSETCAYLKFDTWGTLPAKRGAIAMTASVEAAVARFDAHRASRLPVEPLSNLDAKFPGIEIGGLGVGDGISPSDLTVYGLVVDGKHYRGGCDTRQGPYPFCDAMPLPSYSTAKSIYAGIGLMRLETEIPGVSQRTVAETIEACDAKRWHDVRIEDALDMATGNYRSADYSADEDSDPQVSFIFDDKHADKIDFACNYYKRKSGPQTRFVYHTSDTYLVGTALSNVFAAERPEGGDAYTALLVEPIWHKLGLSPLLDSTKRTYDERAQPFAGYGLTLEADDIVRIASWLGSGDGRLEGTQVIDAGLLQATLQRDLDDSGLPAGGANFRYNNGFWAFDVATTLGCDKSVWVPFLSGFGGITVAIFPNGIVYYYFSDSYTHRWRTGIEASHRIRNLCDFG